MGRGIAKAGKKTGGGVFKFVGKGIKEAGKGLRFIAGKVPVGTRRAGQTVKNIVIKIEEALVMEKIMPNNLKGQHYQHYMDRKAIKAVKLFFLINLPIKKLLERIVVPVEEGLLEAL